jgi:hypothetical protein
MNKPPQLSEEGRFYVTVSNEVQGPYDLDFIEAMVLSGIFPPDLPVCREGSKEWKALGGVRQAPLPPEPVKAAPAPIRFNLTPPKSNNTRNVLIGAGVAALIVILLAVISSSSPSNRTGTGGADYPPKPAPIAFDPDAYLAQKGMTQTGPWTKYAPSPTESDAHYLKFDGKTYEVSDSDDASLKIQQNEMETKARALDESKSEAKELGDEIERERAFLDRTDQDAVDRFNQKVDRYNALGEQVDRQLGEYNAMVDSYNAELVRVGTPVQ